MASTSVRFIGLDWNLPNVIEPVLAKSLGLPLCKEPRPVPGEPADGNGLVPRVAAPPKVHPGWPSFDTLGVTVFDALLR